MEMRLRTLFVAMVIFVLVFAFLNCDQDPDALRTHVPVERLAADLEDAIPGWMEEALVPGLSVAVVRDGEIIWQKAFGVKDAESGDAVADTTIFEAASLSKPLFAYAVMRLVEAGGLDLDTPLLDYVTDDYVEENFLRKAIDDERIRKITARMVLSHTPGFPNWRRNRNLVIQNEPGEQFSYSGEGFGLLQRVVEKLTDQDLSAFMEDHAFGPLNMVHSSYVWTEAYDTQSSSPHDMFGEARSKRKPTRAHAAATLHTTAGDYARFMAAVTSSEGLKEETVGQILTPQINVEPETSENVHWGLGWGLELTENGPGFWHWGDNGPFKAFTLSLHDEKAGVVFFANSQNGLALIEPIVRSALGGDHPAFRSAILSGYAKLDSKDFTFVRTMQADGLEASIRMVREDGIEAQVVSEGFVNSLGYRLLRSEQIEDAIAVFELNVELYPESSNVYDSLGEAYMENGDTELAIANYEKSLELDPDNTNAVERLERLRSGE